MHADRIMSLLARMPGLDDDEIANELAIEPRQTVNQVCRRLAECGKIVRERSSRGKIVNRLPQHSEVQLSPTQEITQGAPANPIRLGRRALIPGDLKKTLLVIPCSKHKQRSVGTAEAGVSIIKSLPLPLADELARARRFVKDKIGIDESSLLPARHRYNGKLYQASGSALDDLAVLGMHIVILSGGYGLVLSNEPIGMYALHLTRRGGHTRYWNDASLLMPSIKASPLFEHLFPRPDPMQKFYDVRGGTRRV